jgi:hypothetical protein
MRIHVQGQGEVTLSKANFVGGGGDIILDSSCDHDVCCGHGTHRQTYYNPSPHLSQVRKTLPKPRLDRWESPPVIWPKVLPRLSPLRGTRPQATPRPGGDEPKPRVFQVWKAVQVWWKVQQSGTSKGNLQLLSCGSPCQKAKATGSRLQGWGLPGSRLRVPQEFRCAVLSSPRWGREVRHHLQDVLHLMGEATGRTGQVRSSLLELPCRTTRGGVG